MLTLTDAGKGTRSIVALRLEFTTQSLILNLSTQPLIVGLELISTIIRLMHRVIRTCLRFFSSTLFVHFITDEVSTKRASACTNQAADRNLPVNTCQYLSTTSASQQAGQAHACSSLVISVYRSVWRLTVSIRSWFWRRRATPLRLQVAPSPG